MTGTPDILDTDNRKLLVQMRESAAAAAVLVHGQSEDALYSDPKRIFALARALEIVAEIAAKVSVDVRRIHSDFPWQDVVQIPARITKDNGDIRLNRMWSVAMDEIPRIIRHLDRILAEPPQA